MKYLVLFGLLALSACGPAKSNYKVGQCIRFYQENNTYQYYIVDKFKDKYSLVNAYMEGNTPMGGGVVMTKTTAELNLENSRVIDCFKELF